MTSYISHGAETARVAAERNVLKAYHQGQVHGNDIRLNATHKSVSIPGALIASDSISQPLRHRRYLGVHGETKEMYVPSAVSSSWADRLSLRKSRNLKMTRRGRVYHSKGLQLALCVSKRWSTAAANVLNGLPLLSEESELSASGSLFDASS